MSEQQQTAAEGSVSGQDACDVIIVGGGLAGLACAVALTRAGVRVRLLESRPRLGGRASSIVDATTGAQIDNCQHVSMGCCINFQQLCDWTDTRRLFAEESELVFIGRDGKQNRLRNSGWPAPLHLGWGFAGLSYLSWRDKLSLGRALRALMRGRPPASGRFSDWLSQQRQSPALVERFWNVVLVSALSESLDRIDYRHARRVFVNGFLKHAEAWKVHLLTIPLGEFYDQHLATWLTARGAEVQCKAGVASLVMQPESPNRVQGVRLRDGRVLTAAACVLATPPDRAEELLPPAVIQTAEFSRLNELETAPIASVHLWLDRELTPLRHAVLVERISQWMFNRTAILQPSPTAENELQPWGQTSGFAAAALPARGALSGGTAQSATTQVLEPPPAMDADSSQRESPQHLADAHAYQVVISNARASWSTLRETASPASQQELIDTVWAELREIWPTSARLLHARAITEHKAVFSVVPGIEELRPPQQTPISNLQLAGDYTQTGWPATMEGAVRSGFLAAENLLRQLRPDSPPEPLLAPDLPIAPLSKLLLGPDL